MGMFSGCPRKRLARLDIPCTSQTWAVTISFVRDADLLDRRLPTRKGYAMGDKGGKKDKEKSKKQKVIKQEQPAKGKPDKDRPK